MNIMKAADGYPIECYGSYYKKRRGVHDICKKCDIYQPSKVNPIKPTYRLQGIHKSGSKDCPLFKPKTKSVL